MTSKHMDTFFHHLPILKEYLVMALKEPSELTTIEHQEDKDKRMKEFFEIGRIMNLTYRDLVSLILREVLDTKEEVA